MVEVSEEMGVDVDSEEEAPWDQEAHDKCWNEFSFNEESNARVNHVRVGDEIEVSDREENPEVVARYKQLFLLGAVPLRTKKEAAEAVMQRIQLLQSLGLKVTRLHSDRGSEFLQKPMVKFLSESGIRQTTSTGGVGASRENGRA